MKEEKFKGLIGASKEGRYSYFVNTVVENETIYSLEYDDSLATTVTENGNPVVCFWQEKEFAEYCKKGAWIDSQIVEIALSDFYMKILTNLKEKKYLVGVFYNNVDMPIVSASLLKKDLKDLIENIGSDWLEEDNEYKNF